MGTMKRFAIVLSGCGVYDGSEIQESVLTMLAIRKAGAEYVAFAPDIPQMHVVNHRSGEQTAGVRNVLIESARIARGKISPLSEFDPGQVDAIILPGGFGAAKNLCTYAVAGTKMTVNPDVEKAVRSMLAAGKPIGALCVAPVILAKLIPGASLTLGAACEDSEAAEAMGAVHVPTCATGIAVDETQNVFTGPCYMFDEATIEQVAACAENVVRAMMAAMEDQE